MKIHDLILSETKAIDLSTPESIDEWLKKRGKRIGGKWTINKDLTVDVDGDVDLSKLSFEKLPVKFNKVAGKFIVRESKLLTLEGCPTEVGTWFDCSHTNISNLIGGPKVINYTKSEHNDTYYANNNAKLVSLEGIAESAKNINLGFCRALTEFDYLPKDVERITAPASGITTLKGIEKKAKHLEHLQINSNPVEEGILGLLKIPSFRMQSLIYRTGNETTPFTMACDILDRIVKGGGDILDAQDALLDAGLEQFAKL